MESCEAGSVEIGTYWEGVIGVSPWLRTLLATGLPAAVLVTGAAHPSYAEHVSHAAELAPYAAEPAPYAAERASYAAERAFPDVARPSADASHAGSPAGVGRARPGRPDSDTSNETDSEDTEATDSDPEADPDAEVPDTSEASIAPQPSPHDAIPAEQSVVRSGPDPQPVLEILPLGSGLILIGLGLGLAFVALRVRRR